ncbi:hypothetical protein BS47DRAFT_1370976 [Hydnum rufescens UP504]|uniref:PIG-U-domain-containing protein n=1 Tax=Hydnum rufescens UP504 TaxID=1448309 RepID=A0A9P6B6J2_9AGAM|nr:hypothetical protein BS47DRAFT_1370976 [Hydnum rufescens UP504]
MSSILTGGRLGVLIFALRSALFFTPLPALLRDDAQLSSTLTSYTRLKEGVYLFRNGFDPYAGGVFRQVGLLVYHALMFIAQCSANYVVPVDGLAAWCLVQIWRIRSNTRNVAQEGLIVTVYLLHPYLLLPTLALSTSTLDNALLILGLYFAAYGKPSPALLILAILACMSPPFALLLPPIILLLMGSPVSSLARPISPQIDYRRMYRLTAEFLLYFSVLTLISSFVAGGWSWTYKTWGAVILLPDLTPNPGLWWYFFTEMFDDFRPFFLMVFSVHLLIYVAPISIKLRHDPLFASFILQGIISTFKSYPTLADPGLFTAMFAIFPEIVLHLRHPLPTVMLHVHAALLLPLFHYLWIVQGTGNANFFYASTLVFGLANAAAIVDALRAGLRIGFGEKPGHELIQR